MDHHNGSHATDKFHVDMGVIQASPKR